MEDKKQITMASFLIIVLNILIAIGVVSCICIAAFSIFSENGAESNTLDIAVNIVLFLTGTGSLILILCNLRKILKTVIKVNPFTMENVKSLKHIACCCFVVTICYLINFFYNNQFKSFSFITIDSKGIHTDMEFAIFFFAGLFVLILAEVYKQAVEVKEENDYTV